MQVLGDLCIVSYWIDTLVLKTEENTYTTLLHHPFLFKGKPTQCSRGSKKDFCRRCRGVYAQVKTYQVPITYPYLPHYIICHLPLVFLSPTSPLPFYSPFFSLLSFTCLFVSRVPSWLVLYLLLCLPRMRSLILNKKREKI